MVIDSNSENVFLVLKFVIDNHTVQYFGIVRHINHTPYTAQTSVSYLSPETLDEKKYKDNRHKSYCLLRCLHKDNQFVVSSDLHLSYPCTR